MPSLYAAKMALCQGLWRIFSIKKCPSTIRRENGVLISPFCVSFSENFLALTICGQNEVFAPPSGQLFLNFLPPTIRRQNRVFAPPSSAYFSKNFCPSLYAAKIAIYQPPGGRFYAKNLPFTIRWQKRLLATPYFKKMSSYI